MFKYALHCTKPGTAGWLDQENWAGAAVFALAEMQSSARKGEFLFRLHFVHFLSAAVLSAARRYSLSQGRTPSFMSTVKARHL